VNLLSHHILECGNRLVPELVSGQVQGGAAMGIGHVLCEYRRFTRMGPTTAPGTSIAIICHASDAVVWQQTAKVLPALSETDPPKGWQRWQMIPIISALVNAIAHVTGQRFRQTSVTAENIRKFVS
jgi:CO/xanthine dehydrogenase Mo-binding subunit